MGIQSSRCIWLQSWPRLVGGKLSLEAFGLFSIGHIEDSELVQINKPGRNRVAVFSGRGLKEPFEKLKQIFLLLQLRWVILNSLFQLTIKDVSFDSWLKPNVHWAALFSHTFKGGDSDLKSGPFGCEFMNEIKTPRVLIEFPEKLKCFKPSFWVWSSVLSVCWLDPCSGSSLFLLILY